MKNHHDIQLFDDLVAEKLGHYVYALIDQETGLPFYIGKGGGRSGKGNSRVVDHFLEAAKPGKGVETEKVQKIQEVWNNGHDVPWRIVSSGLRDEHQALLVERTLIDMLREMRVPLTNIQTGHGSLDNGFKYPTDLRAWCAEPLLRNPPSSKILKRHIFIFNIASGVEARRHQFDKEDPKLYEQATCQFWKVSKKYLTLENALAIGSINGISRSVVEVSNWLPAENNRWEINPRHSTDHAILQDALLFKNLSPILEHCRGFWQRGGYLVIQIENATTIHIARGSQNRTLTIN